MRTSSTVKDPVDPVLNGEENELMRASPNGKPIRTVIRRPTLVRHQDSEEQQQAGAQFGSQDSFTDEVSQPMASTSMLAARDYLPTSPYWYYILLIV